MNILIKIGLCSAIACAAAGSLTADSHSEALENIVAARQGHMKLYKHNMGILGAMAKGAVDYDAAQAKAAAANIAALASLEQSSYWPEGTDDASMDSHSHATNAIWKDLTDFKANSDALTEAAAALAATSGDGRDALGAAMGRVGGTCSACHKKYRHKH